MTEKILQSCYTNASYDRGGNLSSGWQPVAVSMDIPEKAYNACVGFQNLNSTIQREMLDERGDTLNLLEIIGDGTYAYIICTKYGLRDRLGRANMFSHAFIFSWQDGKVLNDPNFILTIDESNFKDNEDEAKSIPDTLKRFEGFNIETALNMSGMGHSEYLKLIQCVYTQLSEKKTSDPLFIQYDGGRLQMKAILYCIYSGLPHYLRKILCTASNSTNNDNKKNIVFSENIENKKYYFITSTGENNILSGRSEKKIERYGFIDYAVKCGIEAEDYFNQLDEMAAKLGDDSASNELILKLAHKFIINSEAESYEDEELEEILSDALRSKSAKSETMEKFIGEMLEEAISRNILLTDETRENLVYKLSVAITDKLKDSGEHYNIYYLGTLPPSKYMEILENMSPPDFKNYAKKLAQTDEGVEILNFYYINGALAGNDISWDKLEKVLEETSFINPGDKIEDCISASAWELYSKELKSDAIKAYDKYISLMEKIVQKSEIEECGNAAKEEYWESLEYSDFSYTLRKEYVYMKASNPKCEIFLSLSDLTNNFSVKNSEEFIVSLQDFFEGLDDDYKDIYTDSKGEITDIILNFLRDKDSEDNIIPLDIWLFMGNIKYKNPFYVFDKYKPALLKNRNSALGSKLTDESEYLKAATDYVKQKGSEARTVKNWITEKEKIAKSGNDKDNTEATGNIFKRIMKLYSGMVENIKNPNKEQPEIKGEEEKFDVNNGETEDSDTVQKTEEVKADILESENTVKNKRQSVKSRKRKR